MTNGYLMLVLHMHLPFVRHPEHETFLEENWLFEAISETYLPLLRMFDRLERDGVPFRIALALSPSLVAMLEDELLQERYVRHLEMLLELGERELQRTQNDPQLHTVARMYRELFQQNYDDFIERYERRILRGFDYYSKKGRVELLTSAATHAFLPLYESHPETVNAQVQVAALEHQRIFGKPARGFWLPECGYFPGAEDFLKEHGFDYFVAATHGLLFSEDRPQAGVYRPVQTPNGLSVFGRDLYSANAVWSGRDGYPGHAAYRDFYRDIGYDLPIDYIGNYIHEGQIRIPTGYKYHAITGGAEDKAFYDPDRAAATVRSHAEDFVDKQQRLVARVGSLMDGPPVISTPYDAELFGHWWFEGPQWLEAVIRRLHDGDTGIAMATPTEQLRTQKPMQTVRPAFSSWGNQGYSEVWIDGRNDWIYPHVHRAVERMVELVRRYPDENGLKERALAQAAREVLLSQASDWAFMMHAGTTVGYAERRVKEHVYNFTTIYDGLCRGSVDTEWLTRLERRHNLFPRLDYRVFSNRQVPRLLRRKSLSIR
jgi:1,4-alpha-glucan branching enzyme